MRNTNFDRILAKYKNSMQSGSTRYKRQMATNHNMLTATEQPYGKTDMKKSFADSFKLTDGILVTIVALISGYLVKKIYIGKSNNPLKKMIGELFLIGVTGFITNHPHEVKVVQNALDLWVHKLKGSPED